jgi:hypothetical protein
MMYPEVAVRVNVESIMLRPPVVQRFLEGRNLEGAARLRRALGFEELVGPRPKSEHRADPASHKLPPQRQRGPKKTEDAIREVGADLVAKGNFPGKTITWKEFQRKVCTALKVELGTRGYSIDTIQKAMRLTLEEQRKSLIAESTKS